LYGHRLEFDVISKIRGTKKFSGIEELKKNIENDVNIAKKIFKIK
jgi:riboflavin kinase/FMN adenylyltransferase